MNSAFPGEAARAATATSITAAGAAAPARVPAAAAGVAVIARKEWLELMRDTRWRLLAAATLLLMGAALALGLLQVQRQHREHEAAEAGDRQVWTAQGSKNPHSAAHFGQYAFKPIGPLALADPGVDAYVGSAVWLEAHRQNEVQFRAARDGTLAARMGQLTLAFVLQAVLPLMAILLGYAAFAAEREHGTLRQVLSLGVRPTRLLAGKALAAAAALLILLAIAGVGMLGGVAVLGGSAGHALALGGDAAARLAMEVIGYALYCGGFLALALAVSARVRSARLALVGLLVFWLLNSFVVPRWVTDAVRQAVPLPTAQAFRAAIAEDKKQLFGHDESHPAFVEFRDGLLRRYGVARVQDLPVSWRGLSLRADDEAGYRIFDRQFGALQARLEHQDALRAVPGFVFPMLALQPLSMALAGTDNRHHHDFITAAERHRRLIQTATSQDMIDHARNGDDGYVSPPDLWQRIGSFAYTEPGLAWALKGLGGPLAALWTWFIGTSLLAWLAVRRLPAL